MSFSKLGSVGRYALSVLRRSLVVLSAVALCFVLIQPSAHAASAAANARTDMDAKENVSDYSQSSRKAERRAEQSRRSQLADEDTEADSLGDIINDKLNLDEIVEDNVLVEGVDDVTAPDEDR